MKKAVLFISHRVNEDTMEKYQKLRNELSECCDVFWALDESKKSISNRKIFLFLGSIYQIFTH